MTDLPETARRRYVRFTGQDFDMRDNAVEEWVEVAPDGVVQREIGFDVSGAVVHLFPSKKYRQGNYGHFDLAPVEPAGHDSVAPAEFDRRWKAADRAAERLPMPPSDIEDFWRGFVARRNGPKWLENLLVLLTAVALLVIGVSVLVFGILSAADGK
jgi:hypothetical protein